VQNSQSQTTAIRPIVRSGAPVKEEGDAGRSLLPVIKPSFLGKDDAADDFHPPVLGSSLLRFIAGDRLIFSYPSSHKAIREGDGNSFGV
jgi:hypothetical protein